MKINISQYYNRFPQRYMGEYKNRHKGGYSTTLMTMQSTVGLLGYTLAREDGKYIVLLRYGGTEGHKVYNPTMGSSRIWDPDFCDHNSSRSPSTI